MLTPPDTCTPLFYLQCATEILVHSDIDTRSCAALLAYQVAHYDRSVVFGIVELIKGNLQLPWK